MIKGNERGWLNQNTDCPGNKKQILKDALTDKVSDFDIKLSEILEEDLEPPIQKEVSNQSSDKTDRHKFLCDTLNYDLDKIFPGFPND